MANRRMFSKKVIDTDTFLDMPDSAQILYFHLALRADDDGFIASPKMIMRMLGSSDDNMKLLVAKGYIIPFESGVCVIKHWRVHNYIQKDRYQETFYKYEKSLIDPDPNNDNEYTLLDTPRIQDVSKTVPQVRDRDRLEIEKETDKTSDMKNTVEIVQFWDNNGFGYNNMQGKESLLLWLDDSSFKNPAEMILEAMNIACAGNKRTLRYVEGILKNWQNENILTLEEVKDRNNKRSNKEPEKKDKYEDMYNDMNF